MQTKKIIIMPNNDICIEGGKYSQPMQCTIAQQLSPGWPRAAAVSVSSSSYRTSRLKSRLYLFVGCCFLIVVVGFNLLLF